MEYAILTHACGHVIGLADENYPGVVMSVPTDIGKQFSDYDVDAIQDMYPH
jgi:hypothetical protein